MYCRQLGGSIIAPGSLLPYQEKLSPMHVDHPQARFLKMGAIDLIPEGTGVVPPPIFHLIRGFMKHLPHI